MNPTVPQTSRAGLLRVSSLRDFYTVVFRHRGAAAAGGLTTLALFLALALLLPDRYRSEAKILLRAGLDARVDPTVTAGGERVSVSETRQSQINSEIEIMTSEPLLRRAAQECGLLALPEGLSEVEAARRSVKVLTKIRDSFTVRPREDSNVVVMTYTDREPARAQRFLDCLLRLYREEHVTVHSSSGAFEFFSEQSAELSELVRRQEEALRILKLETGVTSIEDARAALNQRIQDHERALQDVLSQRAGGEAHVAALEEELRSLSPMAVVQQSKGLPNSAYDTLVGRLYELRLERIEAAAKYLPDSRAMRDLDERIADAERLLQAEGDSGSQVVEGVNRTYQEVEVRLLEQRSELAALAARETALRAQLEDALQKRDGFHGVESRIRDQERELALAEESYKRYAESLEKARIDRALENERVSGISLVQAATVPGKPNGPQRVLLVLLGLFAAGLLGTGVTFGLEALDDSVRTPDDVEAATGLRPIASIPFSRPSFRRHRLPGTGPGIDWWHMPESLQRDYGALGEAWDLENDLQERPRVLAVTSDRAGAGTTTVAANLAETLALQGEGKVLLVDANLADPTLSRMLGARDQVGLSDALIGGFEDVPTVPTPVAELRLLPAGSAGKKLDRGLDPNLLVQELERLAADFAYVVVDLPSVGDVEAVNCLRERCDGLVLVVEADRTRRQVAAFLSKSLASGEGGELAVVLNKRRFPIPAWLYDHL